jgi:hypothetical protein
VYNSGFGDNRFMSLEATRRAPIMPLRQLVEQYLRLAKIFGTPVALRSFGLTAPDLENVFSSYNEDYHISRFFHFSKQEGTVFSIDNEAVTHISIDSEINSIL